MKKMLTLFLYIIVFSCSDSHTFEMEQAASFDDEIFEELKTEKGIPLSTILGDRDVTFLYVSSNECAECISDFIDFNDILPDEMPENANFIYLIYGYDKLSFDYYMEKEQVKINSHIYMIHDTLDVFHAKIHDYYSNNLFLIDKKKNIYRIMSPYPEYEWNFTEIEELVNKEKTC